MLAPAVYVSYVGLVHAPKDGKEGPVPAELGIHELRCW